MNSLLASTHSLMETFDGKLQEFVNDMENVQMVWLEEIQQEAYRMFSSDFSAEPELMPKTPSQKKKNRRKRVSQGTAAHRRFSSNLRRSMMHSLGGIPEGAGANAQPEKEAEQPNRSTRRPKQPEPSKRPTRRGGPGPTEPASEGEQGEGEPASSAPHTASPAQFVAVVEIPATERASADRVSVELAQGLCAATPPEVPVTAASAAAASGRRSSRRHSLTLRRSLAGLRHSMTQESVRRASRRSFRKKALLNSSCSSSSADVHMETDGEEAVEMVDEVIIEDAVEAEPATPERDDQVGEEQKAERTERLSDEGVRRFTRSMAQSSVPASLPPVSSTSTERPHTPGSDVSGKKLPVTCGSLRPRISSKRAVDGPVDVFTSPRKKPSPPKKSQTAVRPNMKSFLHTVQKNQILMMTPGSLGRNVAMKSFIKHSTPLGVELKLGGGLVERERLRLEALKKKQEQEILRKKKMEEEKKRKLEEIKRKKEERLRKVVEARVKEEQKEEEKKKKIEQKLAQMEEKNDKMRVERLAEEKAKKKVATKRQEELEQRRKQQEEEIRRRRAQQAEEEEKRLQELQAKQRAEEEQERAHRLVLAQERERERELERERLRQQQAAEKERAEREKALALQKEREKALALQKEREKALALQKEREKALALQKEVEKAAREKERREAEEKRLKEEQERRAAQQKLVATAAVKSVVNIEVKPQEDPGTLKTHILNETFDHMDSVLKTPVGKGTGLNVTVDVEGSPQSYEITPKGGNKPVVVSNNPEDYGMDQNSDDSTDDESAPRKPIPSWAEGRQLQQAMLQQYFNPVDADSYFGVIEEPKLERIFYKSKPRYFKRTSSAVWHSPPKGVHMTY